MAPARFPKRDHAEKKEAPIKVGTYPPTKEPIIKPNITKVFEDTIKSLKIILDYS